MLIKVENTTAHIDKMDRVRTRAVQDTKISDPQRQERIKFNVKEDLPFTRGGAGKYKKSLGVDIRDLQGKTVLDACSGQGEFVDYSNDNGICAIGLDPYYRNLPLRIKKGKETPKSTKNKIAGIAEALPYKDKVFDLVLSSYGSFYYLSNNYDTKVRRIAAKIMFEEIFRVLKVGGQAKIGKECCETEDDIEFFDGILTEISKDNPNIKWSFSNPEIDKHDVLIVRRLG
jgi:ubiquinone/menaquinone biosynthesis C-methylase UbiE